VCVCVSVCVCECVCVCVCAPVPGLLNSCNTLFFLNHNSVAGLQYRGHQGQVGPRSSWAEAAGPHSWSGGVSDCCVWICDKKTLNRLGERIILLLSRAEAAGPHVWPGGVSDLVVLFKWTCDCNQLSLLEIFTSCVCICDWSFDHWREGVISRVGQNHI
jgi:hypothetical protein